MALSDESRGGDSTIATAAAEPVTNDDVASVLAGNLISVCHSVMP